MVAEVNFVLLLIASTASASFLDDLGLKWPPNMQNLMDLAPVPSFPDFSALMPSFFAPADSGLKLDVLENNNQSARLNCSWVGTGEETANLTLLVDGKEQEEVTKEASGNGIVLTLDWSARNLTFGQGVVVSCTGQAGEEGWASVSSVSELIPVGGQQKLPEGKELFESPNVSSMSEQMIRVGGLSEEKAVEGKKPVESPDEVPEGQQLS